MEYNDKQLQIIETAERLFSSKGYDGTSVRDIAEDAGINIAMISYYFGSKEKLMQAIFEKRTSQLSEKIEGLLKDDSLDPFEKMYALVDDYVERVTAREQFYKLMICEQLMEKNPVIIELLTTLKQRNSDLIGRLLKDGQQKKAFRKGIDTMMLMNTLLGTVLQAFMNRNFYRAYHKMEEVSDIDFHQHLTTKLKKHIKDIFKALLSYEA